MWSRQCQWITLGLLWSGEDWRERGGFSEVCKKKKLEKRDAKKSTFFLPIHMGIGDVLAATCASAGR